MTKTQLRSYAKLLLLLTLPLTATASNQESVEEPVIIEALTQANIIVPTPSSVECDVAGGNYLVSLDSQLEWALQSVSSWIEVSGQDGNFTLSVQPSSSALARKGAVIISSGNTSSVVVVVQNGTSGSQAYGGLEINPSSFQSVVAQAASVDIKISTKGNSVVSSSQAWVTLSSKSKKNGVKNEDGTLSLDGNGTTVVSIAANPYTLSRRVVISITEGDNTEVLVIKQAAATKPSVAPILELDNTDDYFVPVEGVIFEKMVTSNTRWHISAPIWVKVSSKWGHENEMVTFEVTPNLSVEKREGTVTLKTRYENSANEIKHEFKIIQEGAMLIVIPTSIDTIPCTGGNYEFDVKLGVDMPWELYATDGGADWMIVSPDSLYGDRVVRVSVAANNTQEIRSSTVSFRLVKYPVESAVNVVFMQDFCSNVDVATTESEPAPTPQSVKSSSSTLFYTPTGEVGRARIITDVEHEGLHGDVQSVIIGENLSMNVYNSKGWISEYHESPDAVVRVLRLKRKYNYDSDGTTLLSIDTYYYKWNGDIEHISTKEVNTTAEQRTRARLQKEAIYTYNELGYPISSIRYRQRDSRKYYEQFIYNDQNRVEEFISETLEIDVSKMDLSNYNPYVEPDLTKLPYKTLFWKRVKYNRNEYGDPTCINVYNRDGSLNDKPDNYEYKYDSQGNWIEYLGGFSKTKPATRTITYN